MKLVYGLGSSIDCCVESKSHISGTDIIIDGLRDSDNWHPLFDEHVRDTETAVTSYCDKCIKAEGFKVRNNGIRNVRLHNTSIRFCNREIERISLDCCP